MCAFVFLGADVGSAGQSTIHLISLPWPSVGSRPRERARVHAPLLGLEGVLAGVRELQGPKFFYRYFRMVPILFDPTIHRCGWFFFSSRNVQMGRVRVFFGVAAKLVTFSLSPNV